MENFSRAVQASRWFIRWSLPEDYVWWQAGARGPGRLEQRSWIAEDGNAHLVVEAVADELGASLRWATATTTRTTRASSQ
jgi:hypothetical protein